jgi:hypothetical protein
VQVLEDVLIEVVEEHGFELGQAGLVEFEQFVDFVHGAASTPGSS